MMIEFAALAQQCAPAVPVPVAAAIVKTESAFRPLAIGVNHAARVKQPASYEEAVLTAKNLIARGYSIDLGLAQINSKNLPRLNLSVEQVFDPCTNLSALQRIFTQCHASGGNLQRAFSCYNTGNHQSGFSNGYVSRVTRHFNQYSGFNQSPVINRKSLPKNGEDLAVYATALNDQPKNTDHLTIDHIDNRIADLVTAKADAVAEAKRYYSWDIFKDFE